MDATPRNYYRALHLSAVSTHTSMIAGKDSLEGTDNKIDPDRPISMQNRDLALPN
jgi:hypothetical protein